MASEISAQKLDSSSVVAVVPFKEDFDKTEDNTDYGKIMAEKALTAIEQSRRFNVIDRTDFETVLQEVALWEGEHKADFKNKKLSNDALYWYGRRLKADFIVTGSISTLDAPISMVTGSYKATIGFSIKVINVHSNKIYATEDFSIGSGGGITKTFSSRTEAVAAAQSNAVERIKLFVDKYFPNYAIYMRTDDLDKKSEMTKVLIGGGTDKGFRVKQKLDVVLWEIKKMPPEDVGDAEIITLQPDHAIVKITSVKKGKSLEALPNKSDVLYFRSKVE